MKSVLIILVVLIIVVGVLFGLSVYGYSGLQTDFSANGISPQFTFNVDTTAETIINAVQGNWIKAATDYITGVNIEGTFAIENTSIIPLYVPATKDYVVIDGVETANTISTESGWIGPHGTYKEPIDILINKSDIPDIAFSALGSGGEISVKIESQISIGSFTVSRNSERSENVLNSLSSVAEDANSLSVTNYNWSPGVINLGGSSTASIGISGGQSGTYTLQIMKDISLASDAVVRSNTFSYDGSAKNESISFTPTERGNYYVHLVYQGLTVWSQPNDSTRLVVNTVSVPQLSVTSCEWSPSIINVGSRAMASIAISGGSSGTYTLQIMKDILLAPDTVVTSMPFSYDGNTASESISFTPTEASIYYVHLVFQGNTIWSQPDDSSRLEVNGTSVTPSTNPVTPSAAPLSVMSYAWSPGVVNLGSSSTVSVSLSGGQIGTYTLRIMKDISLAPDTVISTKNFSYDGSTIGESIAFTPPNSGKYYIDLVFQGNTVWSQPDDSSRLTVNQVTSGPLSILSYVWSPGAINLGSSSTVSIAISGGQSGTYTLQIMKDITLAPDTVISTNTFSYDGSTTTESLLFTPTSSGTYYIHLVFQGDTVWSQPNDSSRLSVN